MLSEAWPMQRDVLAVKHATRRGPPCQRAIPRRRGEKSLDEADAPAAAAPVEAVTPA